MRSGVAVGRWVAVLIASLLMLLVGPAASASGDARVRFLQAIPGSEAASLHATAEGISERIDRGVQFGELSNYAKVPAGEVTFGLSETPANGPPMAETQETLHNGAHYTVVATRDGQESLMVIREGRADGGTARVRAVNTAPELGTVDVKLGDQAIGKGIGLGDVSAYTSVGPGAYAVSVMNPQDGSTLASRGAVTLSAGTSTTAFVIGSGGEPVDVVVAGDRTAAPRGAPQTGLGGLADGDSPVLLALLAGFLAALAGAAAYVALTARSRRGGP